MTKIDAIVPCYNEEPRIEQVLTVLDKCSFIRKVVVVDDGSTDKSLLIARLFKKVTAIRLENNVGKGEAVKQGLSFVNSDVVFLCDADLRGLSCHSIENLIKTFADNKRTIVVGLTQKSKLRIIHTIRSLIPPLISGIRLVPTEILRNVIKSTQISHYGIEVYMNYYCRINGIGIKTILLEGVNDLPKYRKEFHGWKLFSFEAKNIIGKYLSIYLLELPKDIPYIVSKLVKH